MKWMNVVVYSVLAAAVMMVCVSCPKTDFALENESISKLDPSWAFAQKIMSSDKPAGAYFGCSVAISENYLIVGAEGDSSFQGAAYIYTRGASGWGNEQKITATVGDRQNNDAFGHSVSVYGDYVVIGAYLDDEFGTDAGAAYIYKKEGISWNLKKKLTSTNGTKNTDYFGTAVGINGEFVAVGSPGDDESGSNVGAVMIYKNEADAWNPKVTVYPVPFNANDAFGTSLHIRGDRIIVGAPYRDKNPLFDTMEGAAYVFIRSSDTSWPQSTIFTSIDLVELNNLGTSVAISGGYAFAGAPYVKGLAFYIAQSQQTPSLWAETKLSPSLFTDTDNFGSAISMTDKYAVIGALNKYNAQGSVCIYKFIVDRWEIVRDKNGTVIEYSPDDLKDNDQFGFSASMSDTCFAVGAKFHDFNPASNTDEGAVYIYQLY